jgi:hypothetical protein
MIRILLALIVLGAAAFMYFHHPQRHGVLIGSKNDISAYQWVHTNGAVGRLSMDGDSIRCDLDSLPVADGPNKSWIQLYQQKVMLEENAWYKVRFKAKADKFLQIRVAAAMSKMDFHNLGLAQSVTLTPEWHDYEYAFKASRTDRHIDNVPLFDMSYDTGVVWLKDVVLEEGD